MSRFFGSGDLFDHVVTIASGTATAQVLTVISMVPLARLYSPHDFGLFAIVQSVVAVGITLAALRYDMAIVLPDSEVAALALYRLAARLIAVSSVVITLVLLAALPLVARHYSNLSFARWLVVSGLAIYLMASIVNVQFWLNRHQRYADIAVNRLVQAVAVALFQIVCAFWISGLEGLVVGFVVGQICTLILVQVRTPELRCRPQAGGPSPRDVARTYRKMPLINGPTAVLDALKSGGINVLLGNIAMSGLGQFSLAFQMTKAPVSLLTGAIGQVLLQRLARTKPGYMVPLLRSALWRILLFALPIFGIFYLLAPFLFTFVFGAQWAQAGHIAQAIVPWLFMSTFTSPLASLFIAIEKQEWALVFAVVSTAAAVGLLSVAQLGLLSMVTWLAWTQGGLLVGWLAMALLVARNFDRGGYLDGRAT